jgi:pyruvate/2-oxoacid:ferredoxin oxidoreductase alpha subunit/ferredoxin
MLDWDAALRHLYRRLLGVPPAGEGERDPGLAATLTGAAAVAVVEAAIPTASTASTTSRGLAEAMGRALTGLRGTAFLEGEDGEASDLGAAVARGLPLVAYHGAHPGGAPGASGDGDHDPWHEAARHGAFTLVAADAQEAVDFALLGRRVAEEALLPVVVAMDRGETAQAVQAVRLPSPSLLRTLLGRPEEPIHPPNVAQEQLFGKHRRRVPRWHDPAHPGATGGPPGATSFAAAAARHAYFEAQGPASFAAAGEALARLTGRHRTVLTQHGPRRAEVVVVAMGAAVPVAETVSDALAAAGGPRLGVLGLRLLHPFPGAAVVEALAPLSKTARVLVLERVEAPSAPEGPLALALRAAFSRAVEDGLAANRVPPLHSVLYGLGGQPLAAADLTELCRRLRGSGPGTVPRYLGLDLAPDLRADPKRQAVLDPLLRAYPQIATLGLTAPPESAPSGAGGDDGAAEELPAAARRVYRRDLRRDPRRGDGGRHEALPAFWNRVAGLSRSGATAPLVPDPHLALGVQPAGSAVLRPSAPERPMLPSFDPAPCTGCGACWVACPEGAIQPAVADAKAFLEMGLERAQAVGSPVAPLRGVLSRLAAGLDDALAAQPEGGAAAGPLLDAALGNLLASTPLPEARRASLEEAFAGLRREVGALPLARTDGFFDGAAGNAGSAGSAGATGARALLSLAVDPDACTGCGLCVAVCEPGALAALPWEEARATAARDGVERLLSLPDASEETLDRGHGQGELSSLARCLLPAAQRQILVGGDPAEPGSGEAIALRQVLGAAVLTLRRDRRRGAEGVNAVRQELAAAIHGALEGALPDGDLDVLAQGLDAVGRPEADLAEVAALARLAGQVEEALGSPQVDVARLRRLVSTARELADFVGEWESSAATPFTVMVAAGDTAAWSGGFPFNAFAPAVTFASGSGRGRGGDLAGLARGLLTGQMARTLEGVGALHRARRLLAQPETGAARQRGDRQRGEEAPESLSWSALTEEERCLCPPLVVVAGEDSLSAGDREGLWSLLAEDLPVKVLWLADLGLGLGPGLNSTPSGSRRRSFDPARLVLGPPGAVVAQTSIAHPEHLAASVAAAFRRPGPALLRMHAPRPGRHGFPLDATLRRAREAVASRTFPLFRRDSPPGSAFLDPPGAFTLQEEAGETPAGAETPAHWAFGEQRFAACFTPVEADDGEPVELTDFLALSPEARQGKVATMTEEPKTTEETAETGEAEGREAVVWKVAPALVAAAEERLAQGRMLERLARASGEPEVATAAAPMAVQEQLAALTAEWEERQKRDRSQRETTVRAETARALRRRLLGLMGIEEVRP